MHVQIQTRTIIFETEGSNHILDITAEVQSVISTSGMQEGHVLISAIGSTSGITTLEYEPGLVLHDVAVMFELIAPYGKHYKHNQTWGDDNGGAHLRSMITGTSQTLPFIDGQLILGTWQQIVFMDFDTRPRSRRVVIQITGK
jgi:secondary thiamine-phosphate synthase enzyme